MLVGEGGRGRVPKERAWTKDALVQTGFTWSGAALLLLAFSRAEVQVPFGAIFVCMNSSRPGRRSDPALD